MHMPRRRTLLLLAGTVVVPVALASAAFACQVLSTLSLSSASGRAGAVVTAKGGNYFGTTPVFFRLDSRTAKPFAQAKVVNGEFTTRIKIPATSPGYHTVIAIQYEADGVTPCVGCPGRTSFKVTRSGTAAASSAVGVPGSSRLAGTPLGLLAIGLLLAGNVGVRRLRAQRRPVPTV